MRFGERVVKILDNLFGPHSRNLERALDRTSQRFGLLAGNLANANVSNYKRRDIEFGIELEKAGSKFQSGGGQDGQVKIDQGEVRIDGSSVNMESEVASMADTEMRYQMLTEMTSRYFSGLNSVIREGR